jgi:hypothetical protein
LWVTQSCQIWSCGIDNFTTFVDWQIDPEK